MKNLAAAVEVVEINITVEPRGTHFQRGLPADKRFIGAGSKCKGRGVATDTSRKRLEQARDLTMRPWHQVDREIERRDTRDRGGLPTDAVASLLCPNLS